MKGSPRHVLAIFSVTYACAATLLVSSCSGREAAKEQAQPAEAGKPADLSQASQIFGQPPATAPAAALDPTTVVATVEGQTITQAEVNDEIARTLTRMKDRIPPGRLEDAKAYISRQALDNMITQQILLKAVTDEKIAVTDADMEAELEKIKGRLPANITMDDLYAKNGMDGVEFKRNLKLSLQIDKLIDAHTAGLPKPTDEVVKAFYDDHKDQFEQPETVHASHILVMVDEAATADERAKKKEKIESIRKQLVDGGDFAKLAEENSDDPGSKTNGGDLGTFRRGMMVPPFEEAAFTQKVDEVGEIVESQFGYHIIKVTEHNEPKMLAFDEVKEKLTDMMQKQDKRKAAEDYVDTLRAAAKVDINPAAKANEPPMEMMSPTTMMPAGAPPTASAPAPSAPPPTM